MTVPIKQSKLVAKAVLLLPSVFLLGFIAQPVSAAVDCTDSQVQSYETTQCDSPLSVPPQPSPIFVDATCTTQGSYIIPDTEIQYVVGNATVPAAPGSYDVAAGQTVVITEYVNPDSEQTRDTQTPTWSHTFTAPTCAQVLGDSTTMPNQPKVLGAVLANTGVAVTAANLAACSLIIAAFLVHRQSAKNS